VSNVRCFPRLDDSQPPETILVERLLFTEICTSSNGIGYGQPAGIKSFVWSIGCKLILWVGVGDATPIRKQCTRYSRGVAHRHIIF
jgi:hypothetical protein